MDSLRSLVALAAALAAACSGGEGSGPEADGGDADVDGDTDGDADGDGGDDQAWYAPDPEGRVTEGDVSADPPELVIVAPTPLLDAWRAYGRARDLAGIRTEVEDLAEVLASHEGCDDGERLRSFLIEAHGRGARFALLGGDAELLPYRRVEDQVSIPFAGGYATNGPAELYFSDLDSDWDRDGDGIWGEEGEDLALADLRAAELAVGRVPASTPEEVDRYARKVERFEAEPGGREASPLIMSDVAMTVPGIGDVDAALALEVTIDQLFPEELAASARRLYATDAAARNNGGEVITADLVRQAFAEGHGLVFHNGHGSHDSLTSVIDTALVDGLDNHLPPVMLSCACLSGNFADVASTADFDGWRPQGADEDSAAERYIVDEGGGVAYIGNTGTGLGAAGGSQILHATFEGLFVAGLPTIGEAFIYGRAHMREVSLRIMGFDMPMTDDTERWTQLVSILLGDPTIQPWAGTAAPLEVSAPATYGPGFQELAVAVSGGGAPAEGVVVMLWKEGDLLLRAVTDGSGRAAFRFIPTGPGDLHLEARAPGHLPARATVSPEI